MLIVSGHDAKCIHSACLHLVCQQLANCKAILYRAKLKAVFVCFIFFFSFFRFLFSLDHLWRFYQVQIVIWHIFTGLIVSYNAQLSCNSDLTVTRISGRPFVCYCVFSPACSSMCMKCKRLKNLQKKKLLVHITHKNCVIKQTFGWAFVATCYQSAVSARKSCMLYSCIKYMSTFNTQLLWQKKQKNPEKKWNNFLGWLRRHEHKVDTEADVYDIHCNCSV